MHPYSRDIVAPLHHAKFQHFRKNFSVVQVFLSELSSSPAVGLVILINRLDARNCFLHVPESEKSHSRGHTSFKSRRLGEHRFAAREIMGRAVAKPARASLDVGILSNADLRPRSRNIPLITREIGYPGRFSQYPSVVFKQPDVRLVPLMVLQGDLQFLREPFRQFGEALELFALRSIPLAAIAQITESGPRGNGRETAAGSINLNRPVFHCHRRQGMVPSHSAIWDRSMRGADVEAH